jgi:hypothetical protein
MKISMVVFWVIMAHDLADGYHALEEHITSTFTVEMELTHSSKMFRAVFWVILLCEMISHGSITQKTALNIILTAVRT